MLKMIGSGAASIVLASCAAPTTSPAPAKPSDLPVTKPTAGQSAATQPPALPPTQAPTPIPAKPTTQPLTSATEIIFHVAAETKVLFDGEIEAFQKAQDKIKVKAEYTPNAEFDQKLTTLAAGGQLGDCYYNLIFGTLYPFASAGIHLDLTQLMAGEKDIKITDFFDVCPKLASWEGKLVALPISSHPGFTSQWCNITEFEKAKVALPKWEWTYEKEWVEAMKAVTQIDAGAEKPKRFGVTLDFQAQQALTFIRSWGGDWIDPQTRKKAQFNTEKTTAALLFMRDCIAKHKISPRQEDLVGGATTGQQMFINGLTASYTLGIWEEGTLKKTIADKFKFAGYGMPAGPGGRGSFVGMDSFSINSKSKKSDAAFSFGKSMLTKESTIRQVANGKQPSAIKKYWGETPFSDNPNLEHVKKWMEVAVPWTIPANARVSEFRNAVAQGLQGLLNPKNDFKTELDRLQVAAQAVLDKPQI
jgi:ABC-type glycerol-3-phosphate transport system substrate-binding protein